MGREYIAPIDLKVTDRFGLPRGVALTDEDDPREHEYYPIAAATFYPDSDTLLLEVGRPGATRIEAIDLATTSSLEFRDRGYIHRELEITNYSP